MLECRRYPPQIFPVDDEIRWSWPHMAADDWCGEYTPPPGPPRPLRRPI